MENQVMKQSVDIKNQPDKFSTLLMKPISKEELHNYLIDYYGTPTNPIIATFFLKWIGELPYKNSPALFRFFELTVLAISNQYKKLPSLMELQSILDGNRHELDRIHRDHLLNKKIDVPQLEDLSYLDRAKRMAEQVRALNEQKVEIPPFKLKSVDD